MFPQEKARIRTEWEAQDWSCAKLPRRRMFRKLRKRTEENGSTGCIRKGQKRPQNILTTEIRHTINKGVTSCKIKVFAIPFLA